MKDIETLVDLPDDLSNRLKKHLMLDETKIPNIEPSESKSKQTRSYKAKRSAKQVDSDNQEREALEAVVINTLSLNQIIISNMRESVKFIDQLGDEWEKTIIGMWLQHRKSKINILESTERIHEISSIKGKGKGKGGVEGILTNLTSKAFTEIISEIKTSHDKDIRIVEHNHNFIHVAEQDLKSVLESMGILETTMQAESSLEMAGIQRILMSQKDFDPMGTRQKNFKLAQEQEKKAKVAFHKRSYRLEEIIEFITRMRAPLEMINNAKKFKEHIMAQSTIPSPSSLTLHKIQKIQKVSAEEIQSSEDKGTTPKQENPSISNKRLNEEGLTRHDSLLDSLIKKIKQTRSVFLAQNTVSYDISSSNKLYGEITIRYNDLIKEHQRLSQQLKKETNTLSKILDEDERKQEILHMNRKFDKEIESVTRKIKYMKVEISRYIVMLHKQARRMNRKVNN
jgi:hypothetical protein